MKKSLLSLSLITAFFFSAKAQEISENAIGIRLTENIGFGAEISYQRSLSETNRLELDLGVNRNVDGNYFKATGLYEWVWQLNGNFNWYAGAGGGIGSWSSRDSDAPNDSNTFIFGAGVIGIEYNFDFPLLVSFDFRPEIGFNNRYDGLNTDFGLSARYKF